MSLRSRIALTFLGLLAAVLAAELGAVAVANRKNAEIAVVKQIEHNQRLLTLAAAAVASDDGLRDAIADQDVTTLATALANHGSRIGATLMVLTSLRGSVIAASGSTAAAGTDFLSERVLNSFRGAARAATLLVDNGKIYQVATVTVNSPAPIARLVVGYVLDEDAASGLTKLGGKDSGVLMRSGDAWQPLSVAAALDAVRQAPPQTATAAAARVATDREPGLTAALAGARAPFDALTQMQFLIAGVGLFGFGWAAFWIARNITRPLQNLTDSVDDIRAGNYRVAQSVQRRDEIGVLAEGLQLMQTAVMTRDQAIRRLAYEDTLTGLMNRTAFNAMLSEVLNAAGGAPIGVAVLDIQRFRRINEHLGYSVGDAVLTNVAARLAALPSINSAVARLAADRFAACTRLRDAADLQTWGAALLVPLAEPVSVEAQPIDISATIGLAMAAGNASSAEDLLRSADLALEQARREKRALAIFNAAQSTGAPDQLSLLGELRHAVERDELRLFFQPKIELTTGRVAGAEVLLRWQHPTRGLVGPAAFVAFAEHTGFIRRITRWTLDHAIAQAADWHRAGKQLPLAVNISAEDLTDVQFDARVAGLLTRHQLPPSLLTLELTESGFIDDAERALAQLEALAALGLNLSIDDFGTGYSSLSHLARMPVHELKIDRSFVLGLESGGDYAAIVKSAIDMGHSLGLKVVAEGIENDAAGQNLRRLGCDVAQGYFYAKPMSLDSLERWLEGRERVPVIAVPIAFSAAEVTDTVNLATY